MGNTLDYTAASTADEVLEGTDLSGKMYLVTGVSAGLGVETVRALAARGASIIGTARDTQKAEHALEPVRATLQLGASLDVVDMDLASLTSVRQCASALIEYGFQLDGIIANAGIMACPYGMTADGFELQFGVNHLGHFVMVNQLLPIVRTSGRVVMLSSSSHHRANVSLDDPNWESTAYDPWLAYSRSKTANILFAVALDERSKGQGIRATALHPGAVPTELGRHIPPEVIEQRRTAASSEGTPQVEFKTLEQGAATSVWASCVAPAEEVGGKYVEDCHVAELKTSSAHGGVAQFALDRHMAARLWTLSEDLVGDRRASCRERVSSPV